MNEDHEIIQKLRSKINRALATFKGPGRSILLKMKFFSIERWRDDREVRNTDSGR
jgi:hypothetical protein